MTHQAAIVAEAAEVDFQMARPSLHLGDARERFQIVELAIDALQLDQEPTPDGDGCGHRLRAVGVRKRTNLRAGGGARQGANGRRTAEKRCWPAALAPAACRPEPSSARGARGRATLDAAHGSVAREPTAADAPAPRRDAWAREGEAERGVQRGGAEAWIRVLWFELGLDGRVLREVAGTVGW